MTAPKKVASLFAIIYNLLTFVLLLFTPFLASGDWSWGQGWLFTGSMLLFFVLSRVIAIRLHPGFARERVAAGVMQDTKSWDRWLVPIVALWLPILTLLLAGLDKRLDWSTDLPGWVHWLGLALLVFGYAVGTWAMAVNAFFSSHVRIQKDRGHYVVTTGPYAIIRHPAYSTGVISLYGAPLLLDSLWSFLPVILLSILTVIRTDLEDKTLLEELPGYREYTEKVRFRLIPGVW
jgi:protein-S-isoprenylcysteine O-methyltransferase Ste14